MSSLELGNWSRCTKGETFWTCSVTGKTHIKVHHIQARLTFVTFINDFPDLLVRVTEKTLYADDTKLHDRIPSTNDCERLQESLKI